ncbi:hypothetical protein MVES1_000731 [Malassezia vespertilionis]|uniref:uncharacterized protein n=1 Tax=Malassezia vespertilionis TaxID=2020962 RepID=UPI0024B07FBF|nr:uncharacterized protein MVES1_000731 [Malassezia vespertilionis]WFD05401.1 hypothetical protein MVES1_000731 [Malassezia vespertilionis]
MSKQKGIESKSKSDPVGAANDVLKIKDVLEADGDLWFSNNLVSGTGDDEQVPWGHGAEFKPTPAALGNYLSGYALIPDSFNGFKLNRSMVFRTEGSKSVKVPFYVNANYDADSIERVVLIWPGQWRDSWKYINIMGNAQRVAETHDQLNIDKSKILLISPMFFNQKDADSGAAGDDELYFKNAGWAVGDTSRGPSGFTNVSSFEVMDFFLDHIFDKSNFPNVKHAVMAGHSMGAQATQRYALFGKPKKAYRDNISYWIGNPGSYTWLDEKYYNSSSSCDSASKWPFGFDHAPKYAEKKAKNKESTISRYGDRRILYSFGLNDNGGQSDRCAPNTQGPNRLARGALYVKSLKSVFGDFPSNQLVDFVECVSHQDYPMMAKFRTLEFVFSSRTD